MIQLMIHSQIIPEAGEGSLVFTVYTLYSHSEILPVELSLLELVSNKIKKFCSYLIVPVGQHAKLTTSSTYSCKLAVVVFHAQAASRIQSIILIIQVNVFLVLAPDFRSYLENGYTT
jgi:hypothetical protein